MHTELWLSNSENRWKRCFLFIKCQKKHDSTKCFTFSFFLYLFPFVGRMSTIYLLNSSRHCYQYHKKYWLIDSFWMIHSILLPFSSSLIQKSRHCFYKCDTTFVTSFCTFEKSIIQNLKKGFKDDSLIPTKNPPLPIQSFHFPPTTILLHPRSYMLHPTPLPSYSNPQTISSNAPLELTPYRDWYLLTVYKIQFRLDLLISYSLCIHLLLLFLCNFDDWVLAFFELIVIIVDRGWVLLSGWMMLLLLMSFFWGFVGFCWMVFLEEGDE